MHAAGTAQQARWQAASDGVLVGGPTRVPTRSMLAWARKDDRSHSGVDVAVGDAVPVPVTLELDVPVCDDEVVPVRLELDVPVCDDEVVPVRLELGVPVCEDEVVPVWLELGVSVRDEEGVPVWLTMGVTVGVLLSVPNVWVVADGEGVPDGHSCSFSFRN